MGIKERLEESAAIWGGTDARMGGLLEDEDDFVDKYFNDEV